MNRIRNFIKLSTKQLIALENELVHIQVKIYSVYKISVIL